MILKPDYAINCEKLITRRSKVAKVFKIVCIKGRWVLFILKGMLIQSIDNSGYTMLDQRLFI